MRISTGKKKEATRKRLPPLSFGKVKLTKCLHVAYNQRNKLQRIIEIQTITLEHTRRGVSQVWVFDNIIRPRFVISESTYYNYLSINAKKLLADFEKQKCNQLELF